MCPFLQKGLLHIPFLFQMDNKAKSQVGIFTEPDISVSEAVFVPRPGAIDEDDGVILSLITRDFEERLVGLLILDGQTFKEIGRVAVEAKGPVTVTLHGTFSQNATGAKVFQ